MKNVSKTVLFGALALGLSAAPVMAKDEKSTQTRDVTGFTEIEQDGSSDIVVKVGGKFKVTVEADSRDIDDIKTYVEDGTLIIEREDGRRRGWFRNHYNSTIYITLPSLDGLSSNGSGDAYVEGVKAKDFDLAQRGSGDVEIEGTCTIGDFSNRGSGDLDTRDFKCETVEASTVGSGDMRIYATDEVSVTSRGSGDVDIYGGAKLSKLRTRGSGDVETHN